MTINVFPVPEVKAIPNGATITATTANIQYRATYSFDPAIYRITTSPTTVNATVTLFDSSNNIIGTFVTVSGTVDANVATAVTSLGVSISAGSSVAVSIVAIAKSLSSVAITGTLDTITSTGTYNQTGLLYVVCIGGGAGGAGGSWSGRGGGGGGSGGASAQFVFTNTATTVTIGASGNGGNGAVSFNSPTVGVGNVGGVTSFGNLVSANGGGTANSPENTTSNGGAAGTPGGATGGAGSTDGNNNGSGGSAAINTFLSVKTGTWGGGGGGGSGTGTVGAAGGGSGIGTGGTGGGPSTTNSTAATGYGSGGGGGWGRNGVLNTTGNGSAGSPGVIYVLRGF